MRNALTIGGLIAGVPNSADDSIAKNIFQDLDDEGETSGE
jgi:hypothetical protein